MAATANYMPQRSPQAHFNFGRIFWGELLVLLDLRINGFDLLPDVIGYILIALGCRGLADDSPKFVTASMWSWLLAAASLIAYIVEGEFELVFGLIFVAIECVMVWFLLGGIIDFVRERGRTDLAEVAGVRRFAYILMMCVTMLAVVTAQNARSLAFVAVLGGVITLVVLVMILHLIYRVRHEVA